MVWFDLCASKPNPGMARDPKRLGNDFCVYFYRQVCFLGKEQKIDTALWERIIQPAPGISRWQVCPWPFFPHNMNYTCGFSAGFLPIEMLLLDRPPDLHLDSPTLHDAFKLTNWQDSFSQCLLLMFCNPLTHPPPSLSLVIFIKRIPLYLN